MLPSFSVVNYKTPLFGKKSEWIHAVRVSIEKFTHHNRSEFFADLGVFTDCFEGPENEFVDDNDDSAKYISG